MSGPELTILLVEDDMDHVELIVRCFEDDRSANVIRHVRDGEAALDYLFRRGAYEDPELNPRPQLVLLDLRLPKLNGLEVLGELRASDEFANLPVVVLTTSGANPDIVRAYDLHVNGYLVKPVEFEKFLEMMEATRAFWLSWNQYPAP